MRGTVRGVLVSATTLSLVLTGLLLGPSTASPDPSPSTAPSPGTARAHAVLERARAQVAPGRAAARARLAPGAARTDLTLTLRDLVRARPALSATDRREADAILARPSDPAGDDFFGGTPVQWPRADLAPRGSYCEHGLVACIHWVATGSQSVNPTDTDADAVPDYVETVYATVKEVWDREVGAMHYAAPRADVATGTDNPDGRLDIYLADLSSRGLYGYCAPNDPRSYARQQGAYCVLDTSYTRYGTAPINALRVTAAHEFFHAIQFGYDLTESTSFMEGTATWVEDEVYDQINDNLQFLQRSAITYPRVPLDTEADGFPYGSFLFYKYLAERFGADRIRILWSRSVGAPQAFPVIRASLAPASWATFFATFGSWNTLPAHSYSERAAYPAPRWWSSATLSSRHRSTGWRRVDLPHLTNGTLKLVPASTLARSARMVVEIDAPSRASGSAAVVQRRFRDGRVSQTAVTLDAAGDARVSVPFDRGVLAAVGVVLSNTALSSPTRSFRVQARLR